MINIPVILNNQYCYFFDKEKITNIEGEAIAEISQFPNIRLHEINNDIEEKFLLMQSFSIHSILNDLKKAAVIFSQMNIDVDGYIFDKSTYINKVSSTTGLPKELVESEIFEIVDVIDNLEKILTVQIPGNIKSVFDEREYFVDKNKIGYFPAGKSLFIKVPGNIPTICLYWLIPFVQKRPIFLVPPLEDPFTHLLLIEAIKIVNPQLASCISFISCKEKTLNNLLKISNQIIISESNKNYFLSTPDLLRKTYFIHYGRTKMLITESFKDEYVDVVIRRMTWNCGRTCTGLTSLIVKEDAYKFAVQISEKLNNLYETGVEKLAFFKLETAESINISIDTYIKKGDAVDITQQLRGSGRLLTFSNKAILLPTVILVKNRKSEIFGLELPFPFITIIEAKDEEDIMMFCRNSLILSVISHDHNLFARLSYESSILKLFSNKYIERGYNYIDPHEGYMADFLNQKKAILH